MGEYVSTQTLVIVHMHITGQYEDTVLVVQYHVSHVTGPL